MKLHRKINKAIYDRDKEKPVIRSSICTGERMAGFKDLKTGQFREVMFLRDNKDLDQFLEDYDIAVAEIATEW